MVPASLNDRYVIRFCVCAQNATDADIGKYKGGVGVFRSQNERFLWSGLVYGVVWFGGNRGILGLEFLRLLWYFRDWFLYKFMKIGMFGALIS